MSKTRLELKVGFFVLVCLVLAGTLLLQFGRGTTLFRPTFELILHAKNVGGMKPHANVLMSGVQIGNVSRCKLAPDGKSVTIYLKIYTDYTIYSDARFAIEQSGFLGDQYVAVVPQMNTGGKLGPGSEARAEDPFNLQEAERDARAFLAGLDGTAKKIDAAVDDVRRLVLNEKTLTNLSLAILNFRQVSEDARGTVNDLRRIVQTNEGSANLAVSNVVAFSDRLLNVGLSAQAIISNSAPQVNAALENLKTSSATLTNILGDLQAGRGLAGELLKDPKLAADFTLIASNFSTTSSNLNHLGLWRLFFPKTPKPPATNAPAKH